MRCTKGQVSVYLGTAGVHCGVGYSWVPKKGDLAGYAWTHLLDLIHSCWTCVGRGKEGCLWCVYK